MRDGERNECTATERLSALLCSALGSVTAIGTPGAVTALWGEPSALPAGTISAACRRSPITRRESSSSSAWTCPACSRHSSALSFPSAECPYACESTARTQSIPKPRFGHSAAYTVRVSRLWMRSSVVQLLRCVSAHTGRRRGRVAVGCEREGRAVRNDARARARTGLSVRRTKP